MNHLSKSEIGILIPARLDSTRLANKLLISVEGLPIIEHVRRRAELNHSNIDVVVVSGDQEILRITENNGGQTFYSTEIHENGTSRVEEASRHFAWKQIVVVQGDELLILPRHIDELINEASKDITTPIINSISPVKSEKDILDHSIVKCTLNTQGKILDMFRASPLTSALKNQKMLMYKVLGLFAMSTSLLQNSRNMKTTPLQASESIEQLKLLENLIPIQTILLDANYNSINLKKDLELALDCLKQDTEQRNLLHLILS
jgi:3-deoxy-manno-octulosonate cytidylyltransferase (CMP-KDO synthetase)